jgi:hypothetical protein
MGLQEALDQFSKVNIEPLWRRGDDTMYTLIEGAFATQLERGIEEFHIDQLRAEVPKFVGDKAANFIAIGDYVLALVAQKEEGSYKELRAFPNHNPSPIEYSLKNIERPTTLITNDGRIYFDCQLLAKDTLRLEHFLQLLTKEYSSQR